MSFIFDQLEQFSSRTIHTLQRYPMGSFSAFIVTIVLINLMELSNYPEGNMVVITLTKIAFVSSLGVVLFPALHLFRSHWLMIVLGLGLLSGYYYILPNDIAAAQSNILVRHLFLMVAFFIMLVWAPFSTLKISNRNIWEWTQNLIVALVSAIFFSFVLFLGISLALFAISRLFEVEISELRYVQLAIAIFGLYGVNIFLSQVPKYVLLLQTKTYSKAEIIFTKYILTPLAFGYFLILYAYTAKVLITMDWPKGILAWIIVAFSIVAIITYLFWTPLTKEENTRFKRLIWVAILLQTLMLGVAIWMRIEAYGITESRYFIVLFGAWLLLMSLYFILVNKANYKWLFLSLSVLLVASQFGKYSAAELTQQSQVERLQKMINQVEPLNNQSDIKHRYEISNIIDYLYRYYGIDSLQRAIPDTIHAYEESSQDDNITDYTEYFPYFATKYLGFDYINSQAYDYGNEQAQRAFHTDRKHVSIEGYQWLREVYYYKVNRPFNLNKEPFAIEVHNQTMTVYDNNQTVEFDLSKVVQGLDSFKGSDFMSDGYIDPKKLEYTAENQSIKIKFYMNSLLIAQDGNITSVSGKLLIGEK